LTQNAKPFQISPEDKDRQSEQRLRIIIVIIKHISDDGRVRSSSRVSFFFFRATTATIDDDDDDDDDDSKKTRHQSVQNCPANPAKLPGNVLDRST
jgi:hypothetical protein